MKIQKLHINEKETITREALCKIGETIYYSKGVGSVILQVEFKDGSGMRFRRNEMEDEVEQAERESSNEREDK